VREKVESWIPARWSLLAVKQLANEHLANAGAGRALGGFSGADERQPRARLARRNLGPFLPYERGPDGLFQTFHAMKWFGESAHKEESRPPATSRAVQCPVKSAEFIGSR
jgi:hypothetical protein